MDLERELRQSLQHVEPRAGLAERVLLRAAREERTAARQQQWRWAVACLVLCTALGWPVQRELQVRREGQAAKTQLLQALKVTAAQFEHVRQKLQEPRQ